MNINEVNYVEYLEEKLAFFKKHQESYDYDKYAYGTEREDGGHITKYWFDDGAVWMERTMVITETTWLKQHGLCVPYKAKFYVTSFRGSDEPLDDKNVDFDNYELFKEFYERA